MAMNAVQLAEEIRVTMGFPLPLSPQLIGWASGVIEEIQQNGSATFGGVSGPHPISGITGVSMAAKVAINAGYGFSSPELINFCRGISDHIKNNGQVFYAGPPTDWFLGGTISGLNGAAMASLVRSYVGFPGGITPQLLNKCTAIANHIMTNAEVESGNIT